MSIKITGTEIFTDKLGQLAADISHMNKLALYDAAGYVADELKKALEAMPTYTERDEHRLYGVTPSEKEQIIENFGVSRFENDPDGSKTSIGFTGYVRTPSKRFNDMVPTGMLMQCIEYGTTFRRGTHTISKMEKRIRGQAIQIAQEKLTKEIKKVMEE